MKKQWIIACLIGIQGVNVQAQQPSKYPYQDTKLTAEQRADDLLQRLYPVLIVYPINDIFQLPEFAS